MEQDSYTVYMHINKINGKKYIGRTKTNVNRRWGKNGRNYAKQPFGKAIELYGWNNFEHIIIDENLSMEQANKEEERLIKQYKTYDSEFGYNIEYGGNNSKIASSTKEKLSKNYTPDKKLCYRERNRKEVNQYTKNGELIKKWDAIKDASIELNIKDSDISRCCKRELKQVGGFVWRYATDTFTDEDFIMVNTKKTRVKSVNQYTLDGEFIKHWDSITVASRELKIPDYRISFVAKGKLKHVHHYIFRYCD